MDQIWLADLIVCYLQNHPSAKIQPPSEEDLKNYVSAIAAKNPVLADEKVRGAADGMKLQLQRSSDWTVHNQYYNGWKGSTFVNSVFVFAPDGCIRVCTLNAPGTFHDSTMTEYSIWRVPILGVAKMVPTRKNLFELRLS